MLSMVTYNALVQVLLRAEQLDSALLVCVWIGLLWGVLHIPCAKQGGGWKLLML